MIKTAVILAAGLGSRLGNKTKTMPKGFLEVDRKSLIIHSIEKIIESGITRIIIGTGHHSEYYEALKKDYPMIECIHNEEYATTGSMFTLYNMNKVINEDFLLFESDLLYDKFGLIQLINDKRKNIILSSGKTQSGDEVYIDADKNDKLINMSKLTSELSNIHSELVGISKISKEMYNIMCAYAQREIDKKAKLEYETVIVQAAKQTDVFVKKLDDYAWCEIDDDSHLARALNKVYPIIKVREMKKIKRNVLLNPGPATTTDTVKYAQVVPDICPREKEFGQLMGELGDELVSIVHGDLEKYTAVLFCGSGTINIDACLSSLVPDNKKVLIVNNGAYSDRGREVCDYYHINYVNLKLPTTLPADIEKIETALKADKDIKVVYACHHETGTGVLNPIREIGKVAHKYNATFIVDTTSSYAMIPIDIEKDNLDFIMASAQKGLMAMTGLSFVIGNTKLIEESKNYKTKSYYTNLYMQYDYLKTRGEMHFTPPVQTIYATIQAIKEYWQEGEQEKWLRHQRVWQAIYKGLDKLGFETIINREHQSKLVVSVKYPQDKNWDFEKVHDYCYERGYTIYPGKIASTDTFRLCSLGAIDKRDIEDFFIVFENALRSLSIKLPITQ